MCLKMAYYNKQFCYFGYSQWPLDIFKFGVWEISYFSVMKCKVCYSGGLLSRATSNSRLAVYKEPKWIEFCRDYCWCLRTPKLLRNVAQDSGFLWDKTSMHRDMISGTLCVST